MNAVRRAAFCVVLALVALPVTADDPPRPLTPTERMELETKLGRLNAEGAKAYKADKLIEAAKSFKEALEAARRLYPKQDHPDLVLVLTIQAAILRKLEKPADAEPLAREAVAMRRRLQPNEDTLGLAVDLSTLGSALRDQNKLA